jgi:carbamoyl-phosphate synthase small subunit
MRLTRLIRTKGMPHALIAHRADGVFDDAALVAAARAFPGLVGADLAKDVTAPAAYGWSGGGWRWPEGYGAGAPRRRRVVAVDYGA